MLFSYLRAYIWAAFRSGGKLSSFLAGFETGVMIQQACPEFGDILYAESKDITPGHEARAVDAAVEIMRILFEGGEINAKLAAEFPQGFVFDAKDFLS